MASKSRQKEARGELDSALGKSVYEPARRKPYVFGVQITSALRSTRPRSTLNRERSPLRVTTHGAAENVANAAGCD